MSITGMPGGFLRGHHNVIDAFASEAHYAENLFPVFEALPDELRGRFDHAKNPPPSRQGPVVVASYNDLRKCKRDTVFMEHGSGQTYSGDLASYAGSARREGVSLFLCPNQRVADANLTVHRDIPAVVVGTPKLDPWWGVAPQSDDIVALAWHWDALVCPEARTALAHYEEVLGELAKRFTVVGTAHPRIANIAATIYANAGIEFTTDSKDLYRLARVLVCDNTSLGWEFIAMDRPVVWCNAPWYRREVFHGIRFWEYVDAGIEIDEPVELAWAVEKALTNDTKHARRMEVADALYPIRDGTSAARAARAIVEHVGGEHGRRAAAASQR